VARGVKRVTVDGVEVPGTEISLVDDGATHTAIVVMG